jgi:hypothetical protein
MAAHTYEESQTSKLKALYLGWINAIARVPVNEKVLVLALAAVTLISRLFFQSHILHHWDSVNFAFGVQNFRVLDENPQPPGYILYIWLIRGVNFLTGNSQVSMVLVSVAASALAVVGIYYLGKAMFDRGTGLIAALLLFCSPLFWYYGEIALPHTLDLFLIVLAAWWSYRIMHGETNILYPLVIVLAIAGGIRQQTLLFTLPMVLFSIKKVGFRRILNAGILGFVLCLLWFIPLINSVGGLQHYLTITSEYSYRFQVVTSVFLAGLPGVLQNIKKLVMYTSYALGAAGIPLAIYLLIGIAKRKNDLSLEKWVFIGLWIIPSLLYYTFIHMGQQGLVFVYLPVLILLAAHGIRYLFANSTPKNFAVIMVILSINAAVFLFLPEYPIPGSTQRFTTYDAIRNSDEYYQERFASIQNNFDPKNTAIIALWWHHVEYYLADYPIIRFGPEVSGVYGKDRITLPLSYFGLNIEPGEKGTIVLFDPDLDKANESGAVTKMMDSKDDFNLRYIEVVGGAQVELETFAFRVIN